MATPAHHIIIGNGVAGNHAAAVLRARAPDDRITIITIGALLFYDRYQLPQIFRGKQDWRTYLVHPPSYYEQNRIAVRRKLVDHGSAGISEAEQFRDLVKRLAGRVIAGLPEQTVLESFLHFEQVGMTAADHQG